ncbi:MAG TPA: CPBP family intramembrane glutamic endopeptidase [Actinomycetota bacterium]|nr:CPBP family intramembrane glutamic endopeptidase [Actinomycetota bacterium]
MTPDAPGGSPDPNATRAEPAGPRAPDTHVRHEVLTPLPRRTLAEETLIVLSLSLLASAVFAILSLLEAPLRGVTVASVSQSTQLARQFFSSLFALAPVWLVVYLVRRSGEGLEGIGLRWDRPREDVVRGVILFAIVGIGGIGIYLAAVALGLNRFVVPVPPLHHWWTVPVLVLSAAEAALLEEVVVVAYLVTRLRQLGLTELAAIGLSALLRGSYHLYQGWGGFLGNVAMGVLFGFVFVRTRRAWPIVIAHFLLDVSAGIGFILFREHLPGFR